MQARWTKAKLSRRTRRATFTADQVVFAAASLGTQKLLHRLKLEGDLPRLSDRLGHLTRTNSESILGAIAPDTSVDYSTGVAITSSFHPDADTHVEPVRYGRGSNFMALMQTVLTDGDGPLPRWRTWLRELWAQRRDARLVLRLPALVGADRDRAGHADARQLDHDVPRPGRPAGWRMTSRQGHGAPNPTWIPAGNEVVRRMADGSWAAPPAARSATPSTGR